MSGEWEGGKGDRDRSDFKKYQEATYWKKKEETDKKISKIKKSKKLKDKLKSLEDSQKEELKSTMTELRKQCKSIMNKED